MPSLFSLPVPKRSGALWLLAAAALSLAACGGGDDGTDPGTVPPPSGGGGTVLTAGVPGLTGDWLASGCSAAGGQSFRNLIRATRVNDTTITYANGVVSYANGNCSGTGTLVGPSTLGTVAFSRAESNASVAASWGEFTTVTSTLSAVVWAKKSETVLCLLGDESPSILPTLSAVGASLNTLPASACYTRQ